MYRFLIIAVAALAIARLYEPITLLSESVHSIDDVTISCVSYVILSVPRPLMKWCTKEPFRHPIDDGYI